MTSSLDAVRRTEYPLGASGIGPAARSGAGPRPGLRSPDTRPPRKLKGLSMSVRVRRVYDPPEPEDGVRVLVDRLWPRGLAKDAARVDEWPKTITPSTELRRWYHAGEGSYEEFAGRYEAELAAGEAAEALGHVRDLVRKGDVTLLTASKTPEQSHATVLARLVQA
ncbi:hypothetical protein STAFG_0200 [Streptomyces afghaniensis 772]|uniref:DUF488 family protein n=2 Tax=Streptomyces TaxID=1883 RepID=S4NW06_9ACTN|nr:hypothetical protein STAFG_0200 [Streptomyces afghaniensis 772]